MIIMVKWGGEIVGSTGVWIIENDQIFAYGKIKRGKLTDIYSTFYLNQTVYHVCQREYWLMVVYFVPLDSLHHLVQLYIN